MNATYMYKTGRNNIDFSKSCSKKGTCKRFAPKQSAGVIVADRCLTFIDNVLDFFCSAKFILRAKAAFSFIALLGLIGLIGGIEGGGISLISGSVCLALVILLQYLVIKDEKY